MKCPNKVFKFTLTTFLILMLLVIPYVRPFFIARVSAQTTQDSNSFLDVSRVFGIAETIGIPLPQLVQDGIAVLDGCAETAGGVDAFENLFNQGLSYLEDWAIDKGTNWIQENLPGVAAFGESNTGQALISIGGSLISGLTGGSGSAQQQQAVQETRDIKLDEKERCLDSLAQEAAQVVLQNISDDVLNHIRFGFEGGSAGFVANWEERLLEIGSREVIRKLGDDEFFKDVCSDYVDFIQSDLYYDFYFNVDGGSGGFVPAPPKKVSPDKCNLEKVLEASNGNSASFLAGDFYAGGDNPWNTFNILISDPNSNPVLAKEQSRINLNNQQREAQDIERSTLEASGGFVNDFRCPADRLRTGSTGLCCDDGTSPFNSAAGGQQIDVSNLQNFLQTAGDGVCYDQKTGLPEPPSTPPIIATPGTLLKDLVGGLIDSDITRAENVDEFGEVVGDFADLLIGSVTKEGLLFASSNKILIETGSIEVEDTINGQWLWLQIIGQIERERTYAALCEAVQQTTGIPDPDTKLSPSYPLDFGISTTDLGVTVPSDGIQIQPIIAGLKADPTNPNSAFTGEQCALDPTSNTNWVQGRISYNPGPTFKGWPYVIDIEGATVNCSGLDARLYGTGGTGISSPGVYSITGGLYDLLWQMASPEALELLGQSAGDGLSTQVIPGYEVNHGLNIPLYRYGVDDPEPDLAQIQETFGQLQVSWVDNYTLYPYAYPHLDFDVGWELYRYYVGMDRRASGFDRDSIPQESIEDAFNNVYNNGTYDPVVLSALMSQSESAPVSLLGVEIDNVLAQEIGELFRDGRFDLRDPTRKQLDHISLYGYLVTINDYLGRIGTYLNFVQQYGLDNSSAEEANRIIKDGIGYAANVQKFLASAAVAAAQQSAVTLAGTLSIAAQGIATALPYAAAFYLLVNVFQYLDAIFDQQKVENYLQDRLDQYNTIYNTLSNRLYDAPVYALRDYFEQAIIASGNLNTIAATYQCPGAEVSLPAPILQSPSWVSQPTPGNWILEITTQYAFSCTAHLGFPDGANNQLPATWQITAPPEQQAVNRITIETFTVGSASIYLQCGGDGGVTILNIGPPPASSN